MGRRPQALKLFTAEDRLHEMRELETRLEKAADLNEVKAVLADMRSILYSEMEAGIW